MEENNATVDVPFAAVLLAGGKSERMGFDKATFPIAGQPLWQRQIKILQSLGAAEAWISGPASGPWQGSGIPVIEDETPHLGPMGALVSIFPKIRSKHILVLAVDMPLMTAEFLKKLLCFQKPAVPQNGPWFEPLAAVYAANEFSRLQSLLESDQRSLQVFLRETVGAGGTAAYPVSMAEKELFTNLNEADLLSARY